MKKTKPSTITSTKATVKARLKPHLYLMMTKPLRMVKNALMVTGAFVWLLLLLVCLYVYSVLNKVPDLESTKFQQVREVAVESVQSKIESKAKLKEYRWVAIDNINRDLLYAIVMSEDGQFFSHKGVNWDALISAIGENIKRRELSYGASTISQQVSKNVYMRSNTKSFSRKLSELFTTQELEKHLSKNEILEVYLNVAEFGPDIYGVVHASKYYFGKKAADINAAEGAFLALMLPSPRKYHYSIFQNKYLSARHKRKLRRIFSDMLYKEYISPNQYQAYLKWKYFP